ncbi:hypothetical protein [Ancylobacter terrae]|uniref:hypothetical protein n=1 Tax=Ancylobacter sp. sgz301288 TaxID=3342077 RepID=UPI00385D0024
MAARVSAALVLAVLLDLGGLGATPAQTQGIGITVGGPWGAMGGGAQSGRQATSPYVPYETPPTPPTVASDQGSTSPADAVQMLRGRGFTNIEVIKQRGASIILEATGPRDERVQLVVDGASGSIIGMKVIGFGDKRY